MSQKDKKNKLNIYASKFKFPVIYTLHDSDKKLGDLD